MNFRKEFLKIRFQYEFLYEFSTPLNKAKAWVDEAIKKYEENIEVFVLEITNKINVGERTVSGLISSGVYPEEARPYMFRPEEGKRLINLDKSYRTLHYRVKLRDIVNYDARIYLEFLNDVAEAKVFLNRKKIGEFTDSNARKLANKIISVLPGHPDKY